MRAAYAQGRLAALRKYASSEWGVPPDHGVRRQSNISNAFQANTDLGFTSSMAEPSRMNEGPPQQQGARSFGNATVTTE